MKRLIGGQPLYTKDESVFTDASVICVGNSRNSITYQIRSKHGNVGILTDNEVEQWFNLQKVDVVAVVPTVAEILQGFSLNVSVDHAENIKMIVSSELYNAEKLENNTCALHVSSQNWKRFCELICLATDN